MIGQAYTVRYIPSREDKGGGLEYGADPENYQRQAIDTIPEGAVLVIDCRGLTHVAGLGAVLTRRLIYRKAAGVVLDGGIRDTLDIAALGFPAYCAGPAAPANVVGHRASDMGQPIACGGVAVYPDDIVFGDGEAVLMIPVKYLAEIADEAIDLEAREVFLKEEIESGKSTFGIYPPNAETLKRYDVWRNERSS